LSLTKEKSVEYLDKGIMISLGIHVIGSQWYIALSSIGQGIMLALLIIRLILNHKVYKAESFIYIVFLLFVLSEIISSIFSVNPANSFMNTKRVLLFAGFFVTFTFIKDTKRLRYFLIVFFIFSALLSTYEIIRFYFEAYLPNKNLTLNDMRLQYFGYPITNGEIKMLILLLILPFLFIKENFVLKKYWLALIFAPIFITLFLTASRNAILGLFLGVIVIGILKNRKFLLIFLLVTVLFLLFSPFEIKDRILSIADLNHPSNQSRFVMWQTGLKIIKDHFFVGIGDTDLLQIYTQYKIPVYHGEGVHLHNNFMQVFVSFGIIGLIVWIAMMIYIFCRQIKIYIITRKDNLLNTLALASLASMVAFQISGLTEWNFSDYEFAAVLWFALGLSYLSQKLFLQNAKT